MCPGRKGCKQLDYPHAPSVPLNLWLSSLPPPRGSADHSLGPRHKCGVPSSRCILSGERVIVSPYDVPSPGGLWVHPPAWGMNYCLDGGCRVGVGMARKGLQHLFKGGFCTAKSKPSAALPSSLTTCATLCPPRHTLGGPSEAPGCWVKPGQAAAEPAASEA